MGQIEFAEKSLSEVKFLYDMYLASKTYMNDSDEKSFINTISKELENAHIQILILKNE